MIDIASIAEALGSSGIFVLVYNALASKRTERSAKKAEKRNEAREPLIIESIELGNANKALGNATKVAELLRMGMEELEASRKRLTEEFRDAKLKLETRASELSDENARIRKDLADERQNHEETTADLYKVIAKLQVDLNKLKGSNDI